MADARTPFAESDLEAALADLGTRIAYPPDAAVAPAVAGRLRAEPWQRRSRGLGAGVRHRPVRTVRRSVLLAAGLLVVLAGVAVAAGFGIRGVEIIFSKTPPSVSPRVSPAPSPTGSGPPSLGASLALGDRVSLGEADQRLAGSFAVELPRVRSLGRPDEVYVNFVVPGGEAALVYGSRPGMPAAPQIGVAALVVEFRGSVAQGPFLGKIVGPGTTVERVTVNGEPAIWISGAPHEVYARDRNHQIVPETIRLAGNVLLWEHDGLTLRLETALGRTEAIRIASSVR
jgi:hypothetical protein